MFDRQKQKQNNIIWFLQKLQMSHSRKEEGAVFVIALCLGVIAISAVGLSLFNSAKSKTNTQANEFTKQAMAVTESGNSKTLEALQENPSLLFPAVRQLIEVGREKGYLLV